jgi:hypothetical protein
LQPVAGHDAGIKRREQRVVVSDLYFVEVYQVALPFLVGEAADADSLGLVFLVAFFKLGA